MKALWKRLFKGKPIMGPMGRVEYRQGRGGRWRWYLYVQGAVVCEGPVGGYVNEPTAKRGFARAKVFMAKANI